MGRHSFCHSDHHHWGIGRIVGLTIGGIIIACVFGLAFGWLVMILWNWLMPGLFGFKMLTYWQAFGIVLLARLIIGGLGGHHATHHKHSRNFHGHGHDCSEWDEWVPAGDHRKWRYFRQYWKERGKKDFEEYLKQSGPDADGNEGRTGQGGPLA